MNIREATENAEQIANLCVAIKLLNRAAVLCDRAGSYEASSFVRKDIGRKMRDILRTAEASMPAAWLESHHKTEASKTEQVREIGARKPAIRRETHRNESGEDTYATNEAKALKELKEIQEGGGFTRG